MRFLLNSERISEGISEGLSEGLIILIAKAIDEWISKGVSEGIKAAYLKVIEVIIKKGSLKVSQIAEEIDKPAKTIEQYVSFLKGIGAIEFEGSKKAGGYKVTDYLLKRKWIKVSCREIPQFE